ncbi:MAG: HD domain-containing protein [Patescibacteria group bacterium]|nr:HD domain-containing protein [Patescibacteria group bacterium]
MNSGDWICKTAEEMKKRFSGEGSGHDWWHVYRVWQMSKRLQKTESGDLTVIELAALLHDVADWKFAGGDDFAGGRESRKWLESLSVPEIIIVHVVEIVDHVSYKGSGVPTPMSTLEGKIVQDADRLDAIGAIGIARAFAYGGSKGRPIHDPDADYALQQTAEAYRAGDKATIHHFHNKLLLLRDRMNTKSARQIAFGRHAYLEVFLDEFQAEWVADR